MRKQGMKFTLVVQVAVEEKDGRLKLVLKDVKSKPNVLAIPASSLPSRKGRQPRRKNGKSIHDIVLETAQKLSKKTDEGIFSSVDLFKQAVKKYPALNKKSFTTTVIASAPEHPSWKHYRNGRDHLVYLGGGRYRLRTAAQQ
jgi:hypothetical protein